MPGLDLCGRSKEFCPSLFAKADDKVGLLMPKDHAAEAAVVTACK